MKVIDKTNSFESKIKETRFGTITTLVTGIEISTKGSISFEEKTLLANYVYE